MSATYPSPAITLIDIGEVSNFKAEFVYNFFTIDERTNEEGIVPEHLKKKQSETFNASYIDDFSRKVPRFVKISFQPVRSNNYLTPSNEFKTDDILTSAEKNFSIKKNYDKLIFEDDFTSNSYVNVTFYDNQIDNKMFLAVSGSVAQQSAIFNAKKDAAIQAEIANLKNTTTSKIGSLMDGARMLNEMTPDDIDSDFITKSLVRLDKLGASLISDEMQQEKRRDVFDRIKDIKLNTRINSAIIGDAVRSIVNSSTGILADDFAPSLPAAMSIQEAAASSRVATSLSLSDYESTMEPVFETESTGNNFNNACKLIGYVVEKSAMSPDGIFIKHEPIFIHGINVPGVIDANVAYGLTYTYSIRTVALVTLPSTSPATDDILDATLMIASKPLMQTVECIEMVPPPPPADFNAMYDHGRRTLRLFWNFPVNTQRDVKQFQIFRRKSINDPFTLLRVYDFDDSEIKSLNYEQIFPFLIEEMSSPRTFYDDLEFKRDDTFIYAVCCIDAHGFTSNLSMQFEISFDKYKNRLVKRLISTSGAPKSYPNLYLLHDSFVDVMKDSGHDRVTVYFDPEFLTAFNAKGEDLGLLATDRNDSKYRVQFINMDLQQMQNVDIIINDLRESQESN